MVPVLLRVVLLALIAEKSKRHWTSNYPPNTHLCRDEIGGNEWELLVEQVERSESPLTRFEFFL